MLRFFKMLTAEGRAERRYNHGVTWARLTARDFGLPGINAAKAYLLAKADRGETFTDFERGAASVFGISAKPKPEIRPATPAELYEALNPPMSK